MPPRRPVDLARVRSALASLDALVASGAVDSERTAAWLSGDLPEGPTMTTRDDIPTSLRLPRSLIDRAEALRETLAENPALLALAGPRGVSRSTVLRLAVERGIAALEASDAPAMPGNAPELRAELEGLRAHVDRLLKALSEDSD